MRGHEPDVWDEDDELDDDELLAFHDELNDDYVHGDSIANLSVYRLFAMVPGVGEPAAFRIGQSMRIKASTRIKDLTDDQKQEAYALIRSHLGDR